MSELTSFDRLRIIADQDYRKTLADMELLHRDFEFALDKLDDVLVRVHTIQFLAESMRG